MAEDIQGLLNKIRTDGLERAETEKQQILENARKEAEKILADAKAEAEKIRKDAENDAAVSESKGKAAVQQAARDVVIALNAEIQKRLDAVVRSCIAEAMTPEVMGKIILEMAKTYAAKENADPELEILVQKADAEALEKGIRGKLLESLKKNPEIRLGGDFESGLQIGFKDSDIFYDFSDQAIAEIICRFVGPKLAAMIRG